jgi:hypothetical protein
MVLPRSHAHVETPYGGDLLARVCGPGSRVFVTVLVTVLAD